jgi:HEPN domain-containing protein
MTQDEAVKRWIAGSEDAFETAQQLFQTGKFHHALFFLHLSLEKMLKARIVKTTDEPPLPIHDLLRLATIATVRISEKKISWLAEISTFNVAARL